MSRRRNRWFVSKITNRQRPEKCGRSLVPSSRRLRFEPLEDRRLLANVTVGNTSDVVNGNVTSIAALIGTPGADGISLREAIQAANNTAGADEVTFAAALSGATITLGGTELAISQALVIDARPLAANVTIDANQLSRIFNITATTGDFTLGGLTLTGGRTTATGSVGRGGAIRSLTTGNLTLDQSTVSGNSTTGNFAYGGGISSRKVTLTQSTVSGNSTGGSSAWGGGIFSDGAVTLTQSTVSGNSTAGRRAYGGGIRAGGAVTLTQSTVSGNSTVGRSVFVDQGRAHGGGIFSNGAVTLTQSTVSGNSTSGSGTFEYGGYGGGIFSNGAVTLTQSTVTENHATDYGKGGGVSQTFGPLSISGSIVAGNTAWEGPDLFKFGGMPTVNYSLIGSPPPAGIVGIGNLTGLNPLLGPLLNNGGPTETHALLAGSPAIDVGDPSIVFNPAEFDQRGAPFARVSGGRIDMGAFEVQSIIVPPDLLGDYNLNGVVDAADYVVWRKTLGTNVAPPFSGADGDGDSSVDPGDYDVWQANFGEVFSMSGMGEGSSVDSQELRAEALSARIIEADQVGEPVIRIPTMSAPAITDTAAARAAGFAVLETRSVWQHSSSQSRGTFRRYQVADSDGHDLSLLLAIDRVWRSPEQSVPATAKRESNDQHTDNDLHSLADEPLDVALSAWR